MACTTGGCGSSSAGSGSCNRMNTYDWFANIPLAPGTAYDVVEISFKNGSRKEYFRNTHQLDLFKGDMVVVGAEQGYDLGEVSLSGELVKMQMLKKKVKDSEELLPILRKASAEEISLLNESRGREAETMKMARVISRDLNLDMKIGDAEFQADGKKVTFYYTSEARVDFRELVKRFVTSFKVKIEMRQIGARQEAQRLGGIGSCGRELCCSSFLNEFKSVTTGAARYQQLSINSEKLSGQCGRLKCCLNYELDTYTEAHKIIPKKAEKLKTKEGTAFLRKTDIFKMEMTFNIDKTNTFYKLSVDDVKKVMQLNKNGEVPESLSNFNIIDEPKVKEEKYDDLVGQVSLNTLTKPKKSKSKNKGNKSLEQIKQDGNAVQNTHLAQPRNKPNVAVKNEQNTELKAENTESALNTKPKNKKRRFKKRPPRPNQGGTAQA